MALIRNPYNYNETENKIILTNSPPNWENHRFNDIKINIRNHLYQEQGEVCPYCGLELPPHGEAFYLPIEHIVPKDPHVEFMFEPLNLAVSCQVCNTWKGSKETLVNSSVVDYPTNSDDFIIIHPHFDDYSDHIELIESLFVKAKTDKGNATIWLCNLNRPILAQARAKKLCINHEEVNKKLALKLATENDAQVKNQIISFIDNA